MKAAGDCEDKAGQIPRMQSQPRRHRPRLYIRAFGLNSFVLLSQTGVRGGLVIQLGGTDDGSGIARCDWLRFSLSYSTASWQGWKACSQGAPHPTGGPCHRSRGTRRSRGTVWIHRVGLLPGSSTQVGLLWQTTVLGGVTGASGVHISIEPI